MQQARKDENGATDGDRVIEGDNIQTPPPYRNNRPQVVTSDTARQAPGGGRVLVVLAVSLVALGIIWAVGSALRLF